MTEPCMDPHELMCMSRVGVDNKLVTQSDMRPHYTSGPCLATPTRNGPTQHHVQKHQDSNTHHSESSSKHSTENPFAKRIQEGATQHPDQKQQDSSTHCSVSSTKPSQKKSCTSQHHEQPLDTNTHCSESSSKSAQKKPSSKPFQRDTNQRPDQPQSYDRCTLSLLTAIGVTAERTHNRKTAGNFTFQSF